MSDHRTELRIPRKLEYRREEPPEILRLISVADRFGYLLKPDAARWAWERYSEEIQLSWALMRNLDDFELVEILEDHLEHHYD